MDTFKVTFTCYLQIYMGKFPPYTMFAYFCFIAQLTLSLSHFKIKLIAQIIADSISSLIQMHISKKSPQAY